jgi:hypothetical protein
VYDVGESEHTGIAVNVPPGVAEPVIEAELHTGAAANAGETEKFAASPRAATTMKAESFGETGRPKAELKRGNTLRLFVM